MTQTAQYQPMYLMGRCANGAERDTGTLVHAVPSVGKALCGATYGRRSAGWQFVYLNQSLPQDVTCPRCLKKIAKAQGGVA